MEKHEYFSLLKQGRKWEGLGCSASGLGGMGVGGRGGEGNPRVAEAAGGERGRERLSPRTSRPKEGAGEGPAEAGHRWGASP